jgi:hypothetical protein
VGIAAAADGDNVADAEPAPGPAAEVRELPTVAAPTYGDLTASTSVDDDDAKDEDDCCSAAAVESSPSATDGSRLTPPPLSENEAESAAAIA